MQTAVIDVWTAPLTLSAGTAHRISAFLSQEERRTSETFRFERDRDRFIARRVFARSVLSSYLECEPAELCFAFGANGKPELAATSSALHFNLTHTGDFVALAVSQECELGIDVEELERSTEIEIDDLAADYFSNGERKLLESCSSDQRRRTFLQIWTRKEAYIKALGCGLSRPLTSFDASAGIITEDGQVPDSAWQVIDLDLGPAYVAALAIPEMSYQITHLLWADAFLP